jgi:hypothetical protein
MRLTFTLQSAYTGATYVAGPFNISGTTSAGTTYWLATGVTKTQLSTGHSINTTYETLTGGTIASTGTCTTTRSWTIAPPVPTTATLSYMFEAGYYYFALSEELVDDITITIANVDGHTTVGCGQVAEDTASIQSPVLIEAGITNVNHDAEVQGWGGITYINPANQITLLTYGTILNGGTFTTSSGTVVTVTYNDGCQTYAQ